MVCRPLWVEFPGEQSTFTVDNQYMIGDKHFSFLHIYSEYPEIIELYWALTVFNCQEEPCWPVL